MTGMDHERPQAGRAGCAREGSGEGRAASRRRGPAGAWRCVALAFGALLALVLDPAMAHDGTRHRIPHAVRRAARGRSGTPEPWLDWRPTRKARPWLDRRVRPIYHWPRPCYLDYAPVVFPGPPPPLRPLLSGMLLDTQIVSLAAAFPGSLVPAVALTVTGAQLPSRLAAPEVPGTGPEAAGEPAGAPR